MAVVGIDLGTTNTVIAAVRDGRATALKDGLGRALLPSVISLPAEGEPVVGHDAKERRSLDPENTIFSIKRLIGRSWESEHVQKARQRFPFELKEGPGKATLVRSRGADYTLPEISALVIERARAIAEERLGETVSDVVITVPANFNDLQRAATKVAARVAGLEVLRILNEPTAAALAYGFGKKGRERIAVYDFGGGTFDITLLDLSENVFEVLATAGDTFLGGDDIDMAIVDLMAEELLKKHGIDASKNLNVREQLRFAAEKLKIDLSTRSMAKARVEQVGHGTLSKSIDFEFAMKRSDFEKLCEPWVERTLEVCQEAMNIAGVGTKDLDQVLLVGGSTRIPLVRRRISSFFGKMPQSRVNPDEVVAIGAAIQAAALESRGQSLAPPENRGSIRPPATGRSQFPPAPGIAPGPLGRPAGNTQTGLAGLSKTLAGTGGSQPPGSDGGTREGSILSALPKGTAATRPHMPAVRVRSAPDPLTPAEGEERGPKTLMGVGEPEAVAAVGPRPPLAGMEASRPPALPLGAPGGRGLAKTLTGVAAPANAPLGGHKVVKTLSGVGPETPIGSPPPAGGMPFKTLTGMGEGPSPFKTLVGVAVPSPGAAPTPSTAPAPPGGHNKIGPMKTLSGVGGTLDEPTTAGEVHIAPAAPKPTTTSTLSRLPPIGDSKTTTGITLSRLGPSENSVAMLASTLSGLNRPGSSPPPRTESVSTALGEDDFEDVTSIYPGKPTPSLSPASDQSPLRARSERSTAIEQESEPGGAGPEYADPFADLPASVAPPAPAAADGSVVFDFADLGTSEEGDEDPTIAGNAFGLRTLSATGAEQLLEHESDQADLPSPASRARPDEFAAADLPEVSARRSEPPPVDLPLIGRTKPQYPETDLPTIGHALPTARVELPALQEPPAPRTAAARAAPPLVRPREPEIEELSVSAIDLDDLEASGDDFDEAEFSPPTSGSLDFEAPLDRTQLQGSPPARPTRAGDPAAAPTSLRSALGPSAFDPASFEKTAAAGAGQLASQPSATQQLGSQPLSASTWASPGAAQLGRTALGMPGPALPGQGIPSPATPPLPAAFRGAQSAHDEGTLVGQTRAPLLIDVTPLSLGVEVVGGYVDQLIERNSPIPCERTRTFATSRDHQTQVRVRVSQGEANRFEANTVLGEVELNGLSPGPRGSVKVDITFSLDESGMLQVAARDQATGLKADAVLKLIGVGSIPS